ncbi:MAG: ABC transporter ATP-binding protein/permease [Ruminococcaceae bacterium]|nr:ABC transporter ATP-binding protein/permease [Oscillospiraceae bacterium]
MLELKNITKEYPTGGGKVEALKGIDLQFRSSEFVSILGPSGCGKTTMLNIIGGLDQYTSGDLIINGRSTKHFKDRDWDAYRNHSVGFVFQSYNLIPHQTVLQNVELALTLSGVSKHERRKRAKEALDMVGLSDQLRKRPNQMSGGQMQRVAIARAIVNNPDIILADEPTGALDTETSKQVMEILREISKDRLVIMVTHNPEIAEEYSSRIVRVVDGLVISDSAPLTEEEVHTEHRAEQEKAEKQGKRKEKKPSMSLLTSFGLSLRNLISKKGRTTLTSFAGSIGIIGIALIYAVSQGMTTYINIIQEETLSSYPLTIQAESVDMASLMLTFMGQAQSTGEHDKDGVYEKTMLYDLVNTLNSMETSYNDLKAFKVFIDEQLADPESKLSQALSGVQYTYDLDLMVYTESIDGKIIQSDTMALMQELMIEHLDMDMSAMLQMSESYGFDMEAMAGMSPMGSSVNLFQEILPGDNGAVINEMMYDQYDKIYGEWPNSYNEIVLVVDENNEIDDLTLYALGLKSKADMDALAAASKDKTPVEVEMKSWTFEEICAMDFRVVFNASCYTKVGDVYTDLRKTQEGMKYLYDNGLDLKVTGIIRPNEDASASMLGSTIGYTHLLTEYVIEEAKDSPAILAQLDSPHTDIFTGLPFKENTGNLTDEEKYNAFFDYINELSNAEKAQTYIKIESIPSAEELEGMVAQAMQGYPTVEAKKAVLLQVLLTQTGMSEDELSGYMDNMKEEDILSMFDQIITQQVKMQYAAQVKAQMANIPAEQLVAALTMESANYTLEQCAQYYDEILEFSESSYEDNLLKLGYLDLESPASVNLYATTFESKDVIEEVIAEYNADKDEVSKIQYTDYIGLMMSSITTIINAITYVLIAFVAVSLIVSSIMIGVITLISVQERTKEIGVLRAIGASKKNVSSMFNAETVMIGFAAGAIGVGVTWLLCIPINAILYALTGLGNLRAYLPLPFALLLVAISVLLTMFAGIIPSRSAAKKDPVVALRTE